MNKTSTRLLVALLAAIASFQGVSAQPTILPQDLDERFATILEDEGVPGGAFVVVQGDRVVHASAHGVRVSGEPDPVGVHTVFRLASVSKTFAATLTDLLVIDGLLDWDDRVVSHVPELTFAHPEHARELRIRHLLGQTTGIVPNAYDNLLNANQPLEVILPRFSELEPMCAPGTCYTYQNVLFALVEPAIERVNGQGYEALLEQRVLQPLGMRNASVGMDGYWMASDRAAPHSRRFRGGPWQATEVTENYYHVAPAAGVNASAMDLGQWLIALLGHRPDVVAPETVERLTTPGVRTTRDLRRRAWRDLLTDAHYGLGWRIYSVGDSDLYLHSGWVRGFVAEVAFSREHQIGLGVVLNAESSAMGKFTTSFWQAVLSAEPPTMLAEQADEPARAGGVQGRLVPAATESACLTGYSWG